MFQLKAKLIYNKKIIANYFHCILYAPKIAKKAYPGQFVNIKITDKFDPLLRRPFSIHQVSGSSIEILYEILGKGTEFLSQKKPGEYLDVIGPLGNGFSIRNTQCAMLVAGGMGIAPLVFLAKKLTKRNTQYLPAHPAGGLADRQGSRRNTLVLIGAKTRSQILCEKEFQSLGFDVKIATDDGSKGFKGKITDLLQNFLRSTLYAKRLSVRQAGTTLYACGPKPMLKEISRISKKYNISAQVSLEEHISCGIGACLGCAVNTKSGFRRVCKDGPVFEINDISFD